MAEQWQVRVGCWYFFCRADHATEKGHRVDMAIAKQRVEEMLNEELAKLGFYVDGLYDVTNPDAFRAAADQAMATVNDLLVWPPGFTKRFTLEFDPAGRMTIAAIDRAELPLG